MHQGSLFAELRNAHPIVRLERSPSGWSEARAWAYRDVETDARYAYETSKFGLAEGLAIDDEFSHLVVNNNGEQRLLGKHDVRPQLWVFQRPSE